MAKRKAPYIREALGGAALRLWEDDEDINSTALCRKIHSDNQQLFKNEISDLAEIGLAVLAGRITTAKAEPTGANDLFESEGLAGFYRLRYLDEGRIKTKLVPMKIVTPEMVLGQPPAKERISPKKARHDKIIEEMIAKGETKKSLQEYVNSRRN